MQLLVLKILLIILFQYENFQNFATLGADPADVSNRIIGGQICDMKKYPYMTVIFASSGPCGGALISNEWVLTAAHCMVNASYPEILRVRVGFDPFAPTSAFRRGKKIVNHEKFSMKAMLAIPPELRYDIGLLLVDKPFESTVFKNLAALPSLGYTKSCNVGTAIGVGLDYIIPFTRNYYSKPPMCVDLRIVDRKTCRQTYKNSIIDDTLICTMEPEDGKDACNGDSGGPFICNDYVIGLVSYSKGCGNANVSATFTKVESYLDFIEESMTTFGKRSYRLNPENQSSTKRLGFYCNLLVLVIMFCTVIL